MTYAQQVYELKVTDWMKENNRPAVQSALDTERALKSFGGNYSQKVIDECEAWLSEHTFTTFAESNR